MGLGIYGAVTKKQYHAGYSGLHLVRWLALLTCGFPEQIGGKPSYCAYPTIYVLPEGLTAKDAQNMMYANQMSSAIYPNLMLHSDCEGTYTRGGKVNPKADGWKTGNSVKFLEELETLGKELPDAHKTGRPWELYTDLYELVKDEVKNGKGVIKFC